VQRGAAQGSSANGVAAVQVGGDTSTHHFACPVFTGASVDQQGKRGPAFFFLQGEQGGDGPTHPPSPAAKAERAKASLSWAAVASSCTLFDALIPPPEIDRSNSFQGIKKWGSGRWWLT